MSESRENFPNAPIEEAVIDLHVDRDPGATLAVLDPFIRALATEYPVVQPRMQIEGRFGVEADGTPVNEGSAVQTGWMMQSKDARWVVLARVDGLSVSRVRPYTSWDDLESRAKATWAAYVEHTRPITARRVATRFINRVVIPEESFAWAEWFQTGIRLGPGIPESIGELSFRAVVADGTGATATIMLVTEPRDALGRSPVVLDIDAVRMGAFSPGEEGIWHTLRSLRELKNAVFYNSISERTKELFR